MVVSVYSSLDIFNGMIDYNRIFYTIKNIAFEMNTDYFVI